MQRSTPRGSLVLPSFAFAVALAMPGAARADPVSAARSAIAAVASRRIALFDRVMSSVVHLGVRYELVLTTCEDLVPRGGSDCVDAGHVMLETSVRAVVVATGARLWTRAVGPSMGPRYVLRLAPDGLVVGTAPYDTLLSPLDGHVVRLGRALRH